MNSIVFKRNMDDNNKKREEEDESSSSMMDKLPAKSKVLRARSIRKRLETERNKNSDKTSASASAKLKVSSRSSYSKSSTSSSVERTTQPRTPRQHAAMSRYRRKTANAKERDRMRHVNDAFERLKATLPARTMAMLHPDAKGTKVDTLRWAIGYINSLQTLLEDSESGRLDPALYGGDLERGDEDVVADESNKSKKGKKKRKKKKGGGNSKAKKTKRLQSKPKPVKRTPQYKKHGTKNPISAIVISNTNFVMAQQQQQQQQQRQQQQQQQQQHSPSPVNPSSPVGTLRVQSPTGNEDKILRSDHLPMGGSSSVLGYWSAQHKPPDMTTNQDATSVVLVASSLASPSGCSSVSDSSYADSNMSAGSVSPGRIEATSFGTSNVYGSKQQIFQQQHYNSKPLSNPLLQEIPYQQQQQQQHCWYGGILDDIEAVLKQDENFDGIIPTTTTTTTHL